MRRVLCGEQPQLTLTSEEPWAEAQRTLEDKIQVWQGSSQPGAFQARLLELDALLLSSPGQYCGVKSLVMGVR